MSDSNLKPCPFCGGADIKGGGDDKCVGFWCWTCGAMGPNQYSTGRDWNIRAHEAGPAANPWQLIATAPEDGTRVLLYFPKEDVAIGGMWVEYNDQDYESGVDRTWYGWTTDDGLGDYSLADSDENLHPTHWIPIPNPPKAEPETEGE